MLRYTEKDAKECAESLAKALNKEFDNCFDPLTKKSKIGCWVLNCNPYYGGCEIQEIMNENGGVTLPLGDRLPPKNFCQAVNFSLKVLDISKTKR